MSDRVKANHSSGGASRKIRRLAWAVCIAVWFGAFVATHVPASGLPKVHVSDKTLHFVGFFFLTAVFLLTLTLHGVNPARRTSLAAVLMGLYGAADELTQPLVNRYAAWGDWVADISGAAAAILLWRLVGIIHARRKDISGIRKS